MDKGKFLELYRQGLTDTQIAERLDYTSNYMGTIRRKMGLPINGAGVRQLPRDEERERRQLWAQGMSDYQIAKMLHISRTCVTRWRKRRGLCAHCARGRRSVSKK